MRNAGLDEHKLKSRLPGEIPITSDMQMTPPLWQKERRTKELLDESEREEWKSWLKAQLLQSFTDQDLGTGVDEKKERKREREQYLSGYVENQ